MLHRDGVTFCRSLKIKFRENTAFQQLRMKFYQNSNNVRNCAYYLTAYLVRLFSRLIRGRSVASLREREWLIVHILCWEKLHHNPHRSTLSRLDYQNHPFKLYQKHQWKKVTSSKSTIEDQTTKPKDVFLNEVFISFFHLYIEMKSFLKFSRSAKSKQVNLSQHFCKASGQPLPEEKTTQDSQGNLNLHWSNKFLYIFIISVHIYWYASYTEHITKLIQTKTEPLRNKQLFIKCFYLEGAIFILI